MRWLLSGRLMFTPPLSQEMSFSISAVLWTWNGTVYAQPCARISVGVEIGGGDTAMTRWTENRGLKTIIEARTRIHVMCFKMCSGSRDSLVGSRALCGQVIRPN